MGGFSTLQIARTGLYASQKAMEVTGNNVANANTEGYTRQRLELSSMQNMQNGKYTLSDNVKVGKGVTIDQLTQIRDKYLDVQFRSENSLNSELNTKANSLGYIENTMSEPSEHGISAAMADLFTSLDEFTANSENESLREIVVQNAVKLTDTFKRISDQLTNYHKELNNNISIKVNEINTTAEEIREINKTIAKYEFSGQKANELRDRRNLILDSLSKIVNIHAQESPDGHFRVDIGGTTLVNDLYVNKLETSHSSSKMFKGEEINEVHWQGFSSKVDISGGQLKGLIDICNGNNQDDQGIPYYMDQLDVLANAVVTEFNKINQDGYTLPYSGSESRQGVEFFDSKCLTARDITVSDELLESAYNIAASSEPIVGESYWGNNENAIMFNNLRDKTGLMVGDKAVGNIEEYYQKTISGMAINTGFYSNKSESQLEITNHIDNQRMSISQVSIDEEMTNLIQYQHSYSAAAKLITTIDEMLQVIINMV